MSVESELAKIGKSLAELVAIAKASDTAVETINVDPETIQALKVDPVPVADLNPNVLPAAAPSEIPGAEAAPAANDMFADGEPAAITTPLGLRDLAQKAVVACGTAEGEKAQLMVAFIKNEICIKLSPKDPKLVKIPAASIPVAVKSLRTYAGKLGINI